MNAKLLPYLNFKGNTSEAMKFYQSVFGGELTMTTFAEAHMEVPEEFKNKIMHAQLKNDWMTMMASEGKPAEEIKFGDNISLSINGVDDAKITEIFNKLAEGGKVYIPLEKQTWGDRFGMCADKFGVQWMVNISVNK